MGRPPILASTATPADRERFGEDENGFLVFPARIVEVLASGRLKLAYEDGHCNPLGADGVEEIDQVSP